VWVQGQDIAEVLDLTVSEAVGFFEANPSISRKQQTLQDVVLGMFRFGGGHPTLSGARPSG
jgi:excinuclease ABC subunit A